MSRLMLFVGGLCLVFISLILPAEARGKKKVKRYEAEFTAYYPDDSKMEGGYKDAIGNYLDPSEYTVAAPDTFPLGSYIKVGGMDNWRDGHTYKVTDRGGRIVVQDDGTVSIDILMRNARQANKFGRRKGWIEVAE